MFSGPVGIPNGTDGVYRMDPGTQLSLDVISGSRKRRHTENDESDEEGAENSMSAPVNDIYRSRQQKKVKWMECGFSVLWLCEIENESMEVRRAADETAYVQHEKSVRRNVLSREWKIPFGCCSVKVFSLWNVSEYKVLACVRRFVSFCYMRINLITSVLA